MISAMGYCCAIKTLLCTCLHLITIHVRCLTLIWSMLLIYLFGLYCMDCVDTFRYTVDSVLFTSFVCPHECMYAGE